MGCLPSKTVLLEDNSCFYYDWAVAQGSNCLIEVHIPDFVLQSDNDLVHEIFSEINKAPIDEELNESKNSDVKTNTETNSEESTDDFEELNENCETPGCQENIESSSVLEVEEQLDKNEEKISENDEELKIEVVEIKPDGAHCLIY